MKLSVLLAGVALGVALAPLQAFAFNAAVQPPEEAAPEESDAADDGVISYPVAFFAEFRPVNAMDMLGRLPGFSFDGGSGARGYAGAAGNVLIDGQRPPSRSDSLSSVLSRIPASAILRIDLVRGGAGGIDMQGKPVVANVIRKANTGLTGVTAVGVRIDEGRQYNPNATLQVQRGKDGRAYEGSISYNRGGNPVDNNRRRVTPGGVVLLDTIGVGGNHYRNYGGAGSFEGPLAGGRVRLNAQAGHDNSLFGLTDTLLVPGGFEITGNNFRRTSGEAGLRYTRKIFGDIGLEVVGFQRLGEENSSNEYDTPSFTSSSTSNNRSGESILSGKLQPKAWGAWSLEAGAEVAQNYVESDTAYSFNGTRFLLPGDHGRVEELRTETFTTLTWAPKPTLSIEAGVRYENSTITAAGSAGSSEKTLGYIKPRLNISWSPRMGHQFGLRVERTVDQLSFGSFAASASFSTGIFGAGNPSLEPAKVWRVNGRYEYRFAKQGSVVLEYTHDEISDVLGSVVVVIPDPLGVPQSFVITRNVGDAKRDVLSANAALPLDSFGVPGGLIGLHYQRRYTSTIDPVTFLEHGLNSNEPWEWAANFSQNLVARKISWGIGANAEGPSRYFSPQSYGSRVEAYGAGLNITYRPTPKLSMSLNVNNLTRVRSHGTSTFYTAPRNIGVVQYVETSESHSLRQVGFNMRRTF